MKYITLMFMLLNLCYAVTNGKSLSDLPEDSIGQIAAYNSTLLVEVQTSDQPSNIYSAVFLTNDFIIFQIPRKFKFGQTIKLSLFNMARQLYGSFTISQPPITLNNDYYVIKIPEELHKIISITRSDLFLGESSFIDLIKKHEVFEHQCSLLFVSPYSTTKNIIFTPIHCSNFIHFIFSDKDHYHSYFWISDSDLSPHDYNKIQKYELSDLYIPTFICVTNTCKLLGFFDGYVTILGHHKFGLTSVTDDKFVTSIINFMKHMRDLNPKLNQDIPDHKLSVSLHINYDGGMVNKQIHVHGVLLAVNGQLFLTFHENQDIMPYIDHDTLDKTKIQSLTINGTEIKVQDTYVINKILYIKITVINKETSDQFVKAATKLVMHTNKYTPYLSDRDQIHVENINFRPLLMTIDNTSVITYFQSNPIKSSDKHVFTHTEILQ